MSDFKHEEKGLTSVPQGHEAVRGRSRMRTWSVDFRPHRATSEEITDRARHMMLAEIVKVACE